MNQLSLEQRKHVIASLVEGNSIRATCRMTGVAKGTVLKLLANVGKACEEQEFKLLRNLECKRIQADEIWSFCYSKDKNVPKDKQAKFGYGDVWTWTAIDADTKLAVAWHVGKRDYEGCTRFIERLAYRLKGRTQITTDGHKSYTYVIKDTFGADVDYAILKKLYGVEPPKAPYTRYSPPMVVGIEQKRMWGKPDMKHVSTSYVERQNLTMRMSMRRFTRPTNAFSKKVDNLRYAVALHFFHYNFCRIHQTLRVTPAMEAGVTNRPWEISDIIALLER